VRKSGPPPAGSAESFEADALGTVVPPDGALVRVRVQGSGATADSAASRTRAGIDAIQAAAAAGCALSVDDYAPPSANGWDSWHAVATLKLDIDLAGKDTVEARMAALDACVTPLGPVERPAKAQRDEDLSIDVGAPLLTVDDPQAHVAALWRRHAARLAAVSDGSAAAALHPEDQRCTSQGIVTIEARSLSGVRLGLDLSCARVANERELVGNRSE
jgi:hypothetical protein